MHWSIFSEQLAVHNWNVVVHTSKHLKGQLDPPVSDGNVFAPKEVSWIPFFHGFVG